MKTKQLVILFSILVALVLLTLWQRREALFKPKPADDQSQLLFAGFDPSLAARIELTKPKRQTILTKQDKLWLVSTASEVPADAELVGQLLDQVGRITSGDIASQKVEKFSLFRVDKSGLEVSITSEGGETLVHFYMGKYGPDFASLYLRKEGSNDVLLINQNIRSVFDQSDWRWMRVFGFESHEVEGLSLKYDGQRFSLIKEGDEWRLTQPEEAQAKKTEVESVLNNLAHLRIIDYAEERELPLYGLDDPWLRIEVSLANGGVLSLLAGDKLADEAAYYAKRGEDKYIFTLPVHQLDGMKKKLTDLKEMEEKASPPPKIDEGK